MSGVKLKLMCLVWPDDKPDEHIVQVNIDDDDTVSSLKGKIREEHAPMLDKVAARDLLLWMCSGLPDDDNLEQTLKTLHFDGSDNHLKLVRLTSARKRISQIFEDINSSKEPIHILVEVTPLGECDTCICYSMLKGLVSSIQPIEICPERALRGVHYLSITTGAYLSITTKPLPVS